MKETSDYSDIINLPRPSSPNRDKMSIYDRAAQFSPFAALKGYEDEIDEAARYTDAKIELDGSQISDLNDKLVLLKEQLQLQPTSEQLSVKIIYFKPDGKKSGGEYLTITGKLKKIDEYNRNLILIGGQIVSFDDIYSIEL